MKTRATKYFMDEINKNNDTKKNVVFSRINL